MPAVYRAPMRARELDAGRYAGAVFGVARRMVGIGDALQPAPASLAEAVEIATLTLGVKQGRMLKRFGELPPHVLVWTRVSDDGFHLGRIVGEWRYADDADARAVGIHHVRPAEWTPLLDPATVPGAVRATFDRGGRNFQRIRDAEAEARSEEIWRGAA